MDTYIVFLLVVPITLALGYFIAKWMIENKIGNAKKEAEMIRQGVKAKKLEEEIKLKDFISKKKEKLTEELDIKKEKNEKELNRKKNDLHKEELKLKDVENKLNSNKENVEKREKEVKSKEQSIEDRRHNIEEKEKEVEKEISTVLVKHKKKLEVISGMTTDEALEEMKSTLISKARDDASKMVKDIKDEAKENGDKEAKAIIVSAIQRSAADHSADTTVSVVTLPNDDLKGRIIGREGRNIRSFEQATGIELIVDDTPGAVVLSGFDPYRRSIAKNALEKLIEDGRVHPGKIEEIVERAKKDMEVHIKEIGQDTAMELGVHNLHPELIKLIGRLNYRTSYGQNVLLHSIECAKVCGLMAADLGYDVKTAVRAGLLHDIGKAIDQYQEGTHVELGIELAKKYKENKYIINAIASHHEDYPITHPISALLMAADAISASRPGARRETLGNYLQRIEKLESLALEYDGVTKSYAIQAGREIRVLVENENVDDARADMLAGEIADKIQNEMKYPGHIKVTVIREYRASGTAK